MDAPSETQIPPDRFARYIDELHEFSGTHRVPYGSSENLVQLLEALRNSEGFAADFHSLIRSVFLREQCQVSDSQLLTLVVVAWGGEHADASMDQLPSLVEELRAILRGVMTRGASGLGTRRAEAPAKGPDGPPEPSNFEETIREIEEISPDVQLYRQLLKVQDKKEERPSADQKPVSVQRGLFAQYGEPSSTGSQDTGEPRPVRRLEPSGVEILAMGLTGLVVALLLSVASLPVYRVRVSVYLPSANASSLSLPASDNSTASGTLRSGSLDAALQDGELTQKVAERLLALPHQNPILREDALSRGMRDLHLGGEEPILYADLVADTAHEVKVRPLQSNNLYEITCDSWSSRFATTFCNELIGVLDEQLAGALSAQRGIGSARIVDAATGAGIQVYPHWYLQSLAGLAVGCVAGIAVGFVKRPAAPAVQ